jgi:GTPase
LTLENSPRKERALLVGAYKSGEQALAQEHLEELALLTDTYGAEVVEKVACPLRAIDRATYLGSGKIDELSDLAHLLKVDFVLFDEDISPTQQRNLEKIFQLSVMDRTEIILEVFAQHARTKEAHLQIELAQVRYLFPRLKRMWTHLSRQRGGGVYVKGAGEKQIEVDRRLLEQRLTKLEREIQEVREHRKTQRSLRLRTGVPTFAIVGYTNAGKSTLLNSMTGAGVLVEDKLFATLDTTTRKFTLPNKQDVLLIDTVGFIRKLPHLLVAAFRSTLEEALYADILIHVVDASHPGALDQAAATDAVLKELEAGDCPRITVLNKSDLGNGNGQRLRLEYPKTVSVSALTGDGLDRLAEMMMEELSRLRQQVHLRLPQSEYQLMSEIMEHGEVIQQEYEGNDILVEARVAPELIYKLKPYLMFEDDSE